MLGILSENFPLSNCIKSRNSDLVYKSALSENLKSIIKSTERIISYSDKKLIQEKIAKKHDFFENFFIQSNM